MERFVIRMESEDGIRLRKVNRMKTIHGTLAIEGNTLNEEQVTALLNGKHVVAPPADRVPLLIGDLFEWLNNSQDHVLIKSSVFHYEFEFIHPFMDGNRSKKLLYMQMKPIC